MKLLISPFFLFTLIISFPAHADVTLKSTLSHLSARGILFSSFSTQKYYKNNEYRKIWNETQLTQLQESIHRSAEHGLIPENYHLLTLSFRQQNDLARDILATDAYLTLAGHLLGGKLNPVSMEPAWTAKGREKDLVTYLQQAISSGNIADSIESLAPQQPSYKILKVALAYFRRIVAKGGWKTISPGEILKPGMQGPRVLELRKRLEFSGEIQQGVQDPAFYDENLAIAVRTFQRRSNLEPDGIVGPVTLEKLNQTPQDRINQLRVNLERWRWLPEDLGYKHIRVNIADYKLEAYEDGIITNIHDVVVGKIYRQTPIFSANMTYLVLNPWWEIPSSLARQDILPKFQNNPATIEDMGFQILNEEGKVVAHQLVKWTEFSAKHFPFRVRQKPGVKNALGQVKFMFPNKYNVYLHDTPSRELFSKTRRDFSSGCIRVRKPIDLVEWVVGKDLDWQRFRIDSLLASGKETTINLKQRISVHLLYWTVVKDDEGGGIRFIDDVYDRDERVLAALNIPPQKG